MVWFWMGPDAYTGKEVVDAMNGKAGLIWQWGALDFAGGTVVHINAAVAGLVGLTWWASASATAREAMAPHSLTLTMVGASLLWVGWFGFNAGSALEANGFAASGLHQHLHRDRCCRRWAGAWVKRCSRARLRCWVRPRVPSLAWWPSPRCR